MIHPKYLVTFGASMLVALGSYNLFHGMILGGSAFTTIGVLYFYYIYLKERRAGRG